MRHSKLGLRALGLAILGALSLTAFFAASAQAQTHTEKLHTEFLVHNAVLLPEASTPGEFQINLAAALLEAIGGAQENPGSLLVPGRNLTIDCTGGVIEEGKILNSSEALGKALFSGCEAWNLALTTKLQCTVLSTGEPTGSVRAQPTLVKPILHGGLNYVLFSPEGLNFAEVELHGDKCPLPLVNPVKGSITAEVVVNDVAEPLITFSPAIQLLTDDKLTFGGFPSYIDASATVELTGEHIGSDLGVV